MIKKFNLNLKEPHLEVLNDLKEKFSITSNKEMVNRCIKSALNLNKDERVLYIFGHREEIYILTNRSRLFVIDGQNVINLADYEFFTNITPIVLDESLIIFSAYGDIYEISLEDISLSKKKKFL